MSFINIKVGMYVVGNMQDHPIKEPTKVTTVDGEYAYLEGCEGMWSIQFLKVTIPEVLDLNLVHQWVDGAEVQIKRNGKWVDVKPLSSFWSQDEELRIKPPLEELNARIDQLQECIKKGNHAISVLAQEVREAAEEVMELKKQL